MSFTAALLILAQSAAPQAAVAPEHQARPVAVQARASAKIVRPVSIDFARFDEATQQQPDLEAREAQRSRDAAGTPWIEFS